MATTVRSRIRCNRRAFRVRRRIARVRQSRRSRVHNRDVNRLGVITTAVQHLDHRIEIAGGRCCAGDNAGQGVKSQTCRKRIGENRVTQVRMAATVRSRVRCNRHTLCVCRGVARVRQSCRGRVVHRDGHVRAVRTTRVTHFDHHIKAA